MTTASHHCSFRVYYEDTDAGGIVYYANYLKFAERARTEFLRDRGIEQSSLATKQKIVFVVRHAEIDLRKPARLDDLVDIHTTITQARGASLHMQQSIFCNKTLLAVVKVTIACVSTSLKPTKLPESKT